MGCPVGGLDHNWVKGVEKREENMLSDGQRKWMRECNLCQKLWLLSSKDSPLMTPPSLLFTPIFSPALLCHSFSISPPSSPPSQCFAPSPFFLVSFSLWVATKGWRSGSDVWMSSTNLPVKGQKKVTEQEAEESTPKWWRLVEEFSLSCLPLFGIWRSFSSAHHIFYLPFSLFNIFSCTCNLKLREMEVLGVRWWRRTALETRSGISEEERRESSRAAYRSS